MSDIAGQAENIRAVRTQEAGQMAFAPPQVRSGHFPIPKLLPTGNRLHHRRASQLVIGHVCNGRTTPENRYRGIL